MQRSAIVNTAFHLLQFILLVLLAGNASNAEAEKAQGSNAPSSSFVLNPARVFDTAGGQMRDGWSVLVSGNQIAAVGPSVDIQAPSNAVIIPLPGMTLLPGLMDIHSH